MDFKENDKIAEYIICDYPHIYDKYNYNKDFIKNKIRQINLMNG